MLEGRLSSSDMMRATSPTPSTWVLAGTQILWITVQRNVAFSFTLALSEDLTSEFYTS